VVASDGLWNTMGTNEVGEWLVEQWQGGRGPPLKELASRLARLCCTSPSTAFDNVTLLLVQLNVPAEEGAEGVYKEGVVA
jgi:serine/threonine protein phosphatase PrpC